jgi:hypothetical protein
MVWKRIKPRHTGEAGHIIYVTQNQIELHIRKYGDKSWIVEKFDRFLGMEREIFTGPKPKAIAFARKYMRDNPVG